MNKLIVDRFEDGVAVCEQADRTMLEIPLAQLPADVREGDVLRCEGALYVIDREETQARAHRIREKMNRLTGRR